MDIRPGDTAIKFPKKKENQDTQQNFLFLLTATTSLHVCNLQPSSRTCDRKWEVYKKSHGDCRIRRHPEGLERALPTSSPLRHTTSGLWVGRWPSLQQHSQKNYYFKVITMYQHFPSFWEYCFRITQAKQYLFGWITIKIIAVSLLNLTLEHS